MSDWLQTVVQLEIERRRFISMTAFGGAAFATSGLYAQKLTETPTIAEGPFYPDQMPLDTDNDLLIINDSISPAVGEITHLGGRVLSPSGSPIRNAFVEIWQVDSTASYVHTRGRNPDGNDANFQGYGRFLTDSEGRYYFRTIKPVRYTLFGMFRTPHIHFAVSKNGQRLLTTQMLINGQADNARDGLFRRIQDPAAQKTILVDFEPIADSQLGELRANFDIVLGHTVEELEDGTLRGGISKPQSSGFRGFGRRS